MLMRHAFDRSLHRVEYRTGFSTSRAGRAIERLGASSTASCAATRALERGARDTCVYSIIASEWPAVRAHLEFQLAQK